MKSLVVIAAVLASGSLGCSSSSGSGTGGGSGGDAGAVFTPTVCSIDGWCWYHPTPQGNDLLSIWGSGPDDIWAVGDAGTILHWNGTAWSGLTGVTPGSFRGVWGTGPSDVWAVGDGGAVFHYDGTTWTSMNVGSKATLRAVWGASPTDIWVVGDGVFRWNGTAWSPATISGTSFSGVWGSGPNDVWISGGTQFRWNGTAFVSLHEQLGNDLPMAAVVGFAAPAQVFQVGGNVAFEAAGGVDKWGRHSLPIPISSRLTGVWGVAANDLWAVGAVDNSNTSTAALVRYDGAIWTRVTVTTPFAPKAIWGSSATDVWTVGVNGEITRFNGTAWTSYTTRAAQAPGTMPSGKLLDVWSAAENDAWAPGESGALHFDGSSWKYLQGVAGSNFFTGAYGFAPNDAWLFGPAMGLMHWNGSTLTSALTPTTSGSPVGLWGASSTDLYVADFGGLFHYDGSALALVTIPNVANAKWNDVWGFPNGDLWVVRKAEVKRREGGNWVNKVPLNFAATPERIWGINENDLWLTGFNITLHWTGTAFETLSLSAPFSSGSCSAAHGVAANDVWLTCTMGYLAPEDAFKIGPAMLHWNGTAVTVSETGTRGPDQGLTSVFARTADDVWAVGTRKSIVRRRK